MRVPFCKGCAPSVTQTCINRYEQGQDEPGFGKLVLLAQLLGTTTNFLLGLTDCEQVPSTPDASLAPQEWVSQYLLYNVQITMSNLVSARPAQRTEKGAAWETPF